VQIDEPGTVDDLVADAATAGYQVTVRLIRDWASAGLLERGSPASSGTLPESDAVFRSEQNSPTARSVIMNIVQSSAWNHAVAN
jgi:hypothetical protein